MKETNPEEPVNNSNSILIENTSETKDIKSQLEFNNMKEFEKEASNIFFMPINIKENYQGKYDK